MTEKPFSEEDVNELLRELADARNLSEQMSERQGQREDDIRKTEDRVQALRERAESTISALGCADPRAKDIHKAMADMVIRWEIFKDRGKLKLR